MAKVNPSSGNETKLDTFSWVIFKPDTIYFLSTFKFEISQFYD